MYANKQSLKQKLQLYYITAVFSFLFALIGFSYNAWRMESSEDNNTIRIASFEVLKNLAEFEQVLYAAHYDKDSATGSPRIGWIKVGLVNDLSTLINEDVMKKAHTLKMNWADNWALVAKDEVVLNKLVNDIDKVRGAITYELKELR